MNRRGLADGAAARGVASFYADLHARSGAQRVCRGTSCALAGGDTLFDALGRTYVCEPVYCLGYCDRSPAVLRTDSSVAAGPGIDAATLLERPATSNGSSIRSIARETIVTARLGRGDHSALPTARAAGVYGGLSRALGEPPANIVAMLERSGERGRGGAGFPTGTKWRICGGTPADRRFVVANGDEGDPGSFIDRLLMEEDPHAVLEGLAIAGYAVGAEEGIVFVRSEYPRARERLEAAVVEARQAGILGARVLGRAFAFDVRVVTGHGSYVCGEETALLNAIEGRRGEVRLRPPYPAAAGLHGKPTVVDNVETLVNVPWIVSHGAEAYGALGTKGSSGTKALCLNHGFERPGVLEVEFGISLGDVIANAAGGGRGGEPLAAVLLGGPKGGVLAPERWDVPVCYDAMDAAGIRLGHGGLVALPASADLRALLVHWLRFMRDESCGKCVPCRLGSERAVAIASRAGDRVDRERLLRLCGVMSAGSLCAFGQLLPAPVREIVDLLERRSP